MDSKLREKHVDTTEKIENDGGKRMPHERDESPDGQDEDPRGVMKQAASDLEQGLVDTDLRGTPGIDQVVPQNGASGQAKPRADAADGMRLATPVRGKDNQH
ncbi:hypothetical protein [Massilia sp. TWR1-2-2]|uniref:hypothetical protein n=1 Tax=Massilia sp. TWR1-2-2 TaxID=2804584 RepID=UPI003CF57F83